MDKRAIKSIHVPNRLIVDPMKKRVGDDEFPIEPCPKCGMEVFGIPLYEIGESGTQVVDDILIHWAEGIVICYCGEHVKVSRST